MEWVLRAYDHERVLLEEALPVRRLWTLLESGGTRDRHKEREGLRARPDVWARETVVARLEALMQEGYGDDSLARLRAPAPVLRDGVHRGHWPPIARDEAAALREDLVFYHTYGLWHAPLADVARALNLRISDTGIVSHQPSDAEGGAWWDALNDVEDQEMFRNRFGPAIRAQGTAGGQPLEQQAQTAVTDAWQLLAPAARLLQAARETGLRVIGYPEDPQHDGLTAIIERDLLSG